MPDRYARERYNPTLPHCGRLALLFDGKMLTMIGAGPMKSYPADSGTPTDYDKNGQPMFDYSSAQQRKAGIGPISVGIYWIRPDEIFKAGVFCNTDA